MHPDETLIRGACAAFAAGDVPGVLAVLAEDVAWRVPGGNRASGTFRGHQEVVEHPTTVFELSGGTFALHVDPVLADDEGAAVFAGVTGSRDGADLAYRHAHLWTVRDGRVTCFEEFVDDASSQDALFA